MSVDSYYNTGTNGDVSLPHNSHHPPKYKAQNQTSPLVHKPREARSSFSISLNKPHSRISWSPWPSCRSSHGVWFREAIDRFYWTGFELRFDIISPFSPFTEQKLRTVVLFAKGFRVVNLHFCRLEFELFFLELEN